MSHLSPLLRLLSETSQTFDLRFLFGRRWANDGVAGLRRSVLVVVGSVLVAGMQRSAVVGEGSVPSVVIKRAGYAVPGVFDGRGANRLRNADATSVIDEDVADPFEADEVFVWHADRTVPSSRFEEYINLRSRKGELETLVEEMKASSEAATMSESSFVADSPSHAVSPVRRPSPTGRTSAAGFRALLPDEYVLETDGRRFACKIIEKRKLAPSARKRMEVAAQLRREVEVLRRVDHPHIAKLEQSFEDDNYLILVMELSR
ncbi:Calcium/calmodulin-dependent/calcium-dependent protein kinase [Phytophthora cactorum]|nr:Calcium/calmodulin-dependent/calcium-dependent protein kinase [Phytophthora cactorum]